MRADHENLRAPDDADVYEAERYVEASRAAFDDTLTRLQRRISVEGIADSALDSLRHGSGARFGRNLRESVVRNPLPVTVSVLGMAWTALAERYPPSGGGDGRRSVRRLKEAGAEGADRLRSSAREWMEQGRSGAYAARSRMQQWRGAAAERSQESVQRVRIFSHEHPLIVAGAGLTLGAVMAALLPPTRAEDQRLGGMRDAMLEDVQSGMEHETRSGKNERRARERQSGAEAGRRESGPKMEASERTPAAERRPAEAVAYPPRQEALEESVGRIDVPVGSDQGPETQAPPPGSQDEMRP
ncbi:MAG: hypothetical protein RBT81_02990 [Gammaproteobacteria bacterium]|jgi:ElaB/YqjD/DUF883 family membrane-anchored ribosome-binding protein|nr:hypothetical protein [Gammaproteobacteria bacterium]